MRGRTLNDSFVILDEAQNTTSEQMKMFHTRGWDSTPKAVIITGDVTQIDLPLGGRRSGSCGGHRSGGQNRRHRHGLFQRARRRSSTISYSRSSRPMTNSARPPQARASAGHVVGRGRTTDLAKFHQWGFRRKRRPEYGRRKDRRPEVTSTADMILNGQRRVPIALAPLATFFECARCELRFPQGSVTVPLS